jgi:DNA repair protein RadC
MKPKLKFIDKGTTEAYLGDKSKSGHRERLRQRFLAGLEQAYSDEAILELLLTYSLPQQDVQPLAKKLISEFGSLSGVLSASLDDLSMIKGIKAHSAVLIKLTHWIRSKYTDRKSTKPAQSIAEGKQAPLFHEPFQAPENREERPESRPDLLPRRGTDMFGKAVLREAIAILPALPATQSPGEIRDFLKKNLHFSGEQTRHRYANYIVRRLFPTRHIDASLLTFAVRYRESQDLRDVCFYRFCKAEPLMLDIASDLILPALGTGRITRERLRHYLLKRFPSSGGIGDCAKAVVDALQAGRIVKADRAAISFGYREVSIPAFAFVLHSEFPKPGMYDIAKLESNPAIRALLWNPAKILPLLYELRNCGLLSKVSQIDSFRQFTTRWVLDELVERLVAKEREA